MAYVARLKKKYNEEVAPALMQKFQYKSVMQIPRIDKIVVSVGCGDCKDNAKMLESVVKDISAITGQHAVATVARKSRRELQAPRGHEGRRQGHAASGPYVGVHGPSVQRGSAPRP